MTQHATCVVAHGNGALLIGASGSGKSSLALMMMGYGARLVADDRVILRVNKNDIIASAPTEIHGLIEARGIGILRADAVTDATVKVVIDLDQIELERLPPNRHTILLGHPLPLLYKSETPQFPAAVMQFLACGRQNE